MSLDGDTLALRPVTSHERAMPRPAEPDQSNSVGRNSIVVKRLAPGAPGTRRWLESYGESLVCVRYRHDKTRGRRYTTVEITVDQGPLRRPDALVRIAWGEAALGRRARELGGQWLPERKLWRLSRTAIRTLGLEDRIVEDCQ